MRTTTTTTTRKKKTEQHNMGIENYQTPPTTLLVHIHLRARRHAYTQLFFCLGYTGSTQGLANESLVTRIY